MSIEPLDFPEVKKYEQTAFIRVRNQNIIYTMSKKSRFWM